MRSFGFALVAVALVATGQALQTTGAAKAPDDKAKGAEKKRAYVTMLVNDERDDSYAKSAAALAFTLKQKSKYPVLVAVTKNISETTRCQLKAAGAQLREIEEIMDECPSPLPVCDGSKGSYDRRWVSQFTKINLWKWDDYDQLAFYDADHLILSDVDDVFDKCDQVFCTATDDSQGGFFVMRPGKDTGVELMKAYEGAKKTNWTYDGEKMWNEQPLLVKFFMKKMGTLPMKLGYNYHGSSYKGFPSYNMMKAIHSKFWVEPLTPGRDVWYSLVQKVNQDVIAQGCKSFENINPISKQDMAKDFLGQALSGKKLKDIQVKGFR